MNALFDGTPYDAVDQVESIHNLIGRYNDIGEAFPPRLRTTRRCRTSSIGCATRPSWSRSRLTPMPTYTIFETMNDRGLSLEQHRHAQGLLAGEHHRRAKRAEANKEIKQWLLTFAKRDSERDTKESEADFFKAWLRAKYAQDIRERKKGAKPEDFDLIGTEYHRWVRAKDDLDRAEHQ
jgi:hypothetical protein